MNLNKDIILQYGLIYGGVSVLYVLISYLLGLDFMVSWFNIGFSMVYPFIMALLLGLKVRKFKLGYISWKESFYYLFLILGAGMFVYLTFNIFLNTVIDPDLPMDIYDKTVEKTMSFMEGLGTSEADLEKTYEQFAVQREEMLNQYTISGFIQSFISSLFIAALVSLFIKRTDPNPFSETE